MGRAAGEGSDFVVLTSDNPRSEDPEAIMQDALPGLLATGTKFVAEPDRARAIRIAVEEARPGDIVLLAGKGHEKEQVLRDGAIPFDDVEVAADAIRAATGVRASKLTLEQIARWSAADGVRGGDAVTATGYSIDSRTLLPGDLFFAIRGERFDGHDFVAAALERGACAAVIGRDRAAGLQESAAKYPLLAADDPLAALQRLASAVRRHWGKRVIGITGSAGKTTTKEAVAAVVGTRFAVLKSQGNLNNGYGLPLQLLKLEPEHEVAVIEMGMSAAGEIAALCHIAAPDWGVVTNVGHAHAEGFADGIAGIARAKYKLVAALPRHGVAFLNCDDPYVSQFGRDFEGKAVYLGRGPCGDPHVESLQLLGAEGLTMRVRAGEQHCELNLHLPGEHNGWNALAAIAVGVEAGIPLADCCSALEKLQPEDKRRADSDRARRNPYQ